MSGSDHHDDAGRDRGAPQGRDRSGSWAVRATVALLAHPGLWTTAVRQIRVLAPSGWWRRSPHLPLPDPAYLRFRMQTAYGDPDHDPAPADIVTYLHWCRAWPHLTG